MGAKSLFKCFLPVAFTIALSALSALAMTDSPIKIGVNVPLTGFAASDGESALNGAKLAVDQINKAGGVDGRKLELVVYDDQASPKESVAIATKLIEKDKVAVGVSCSYSGATRAAAGVYQAAKIPYLSAYAIHPDITRAGDYVFRTSFVGEVQGRAGAKLVGDLLKKNRAVLITLNNDFGISLAAGFKEKAGEYGVTIVNEYTYSIKDRQFGPIVAKVKADKPDVIYATGYFFTAGPLVTQLRAAGVDATIIGQEGFDTQTFIDIAGTAAEGVIITTSLGRDSKSQETQDFIAQYEMMFNHKTDMVAASGHTAVKVAADAIKRAGTTDSAAVRDAIAATNLAASTGTISFNSLGEIIKDVQVQVVKDGQFHDFAVISDAKLLAPPTE
ncbi:ABC transporter substrate-binding protein [Desulforhopalus sp. IMCC35007]|uniref:ABC transporter substrate-binding protein n=1 Tax=Desulforhopalus sp. IMCC35007 TaxID=2569543 RepID=UPI0010ADC524|nr:ABC transporter substrate-binding protein [Desulforhopalus sp. IMCC35007]TKB05859.1 branched-chain amino acid ABC transporter substrate-binding protein [Desulforhopalus sp. IMCC35007]